MGYAYPSIGSPAVIDIGHLSHDVRVGVRVRGSAPGFSAMSWMRLPQVSSKTATTAVPMSVVGEHHAFAGEPLVLGPDVVDGELRERDAVLGKRITVRLHGRVTRGLQ
ncbi:MAG: hypothetical protein JWM79_173 [Nocardioides sp.]|nr:hypothetical protein [Nocardioides sp.]